MNKTKSFRKTGRRIFRKTGRKTVRRTGKKIVRGGTPTNITSREHLIDAVNSGKYNAYQVKNDGTGELVVVHKVPKGETLSKEILDSLVNYYEKNYQISAASIDEPSK